MKVDKKSIQALGAGGILLLCLSLLFGRNLLFEVGVRVGLFVPNPIRQFVAEDATPPDWVSVWFTNPACPPERQRTNGLDQLIADELLSAERSIDLAAFELNAAPMIKALRKQAGQGVTVRVVVDSDETDPAVVDQLRRGGVEVVGDDRSALMHNKFVVIDDEVVWTGSLNYTTNGSYCNHNNAVRFVSPQLAANFSAEIDEMVTQRAFGPTSPDNTPFESIRIDNIPIEAYFASEKKLAPIIADRIASAETEILFLAYSFTEDEIGEAVMAQAKAGLGVQGVFETTGSETEYSYFGPLNEMRGVDVQVRQDGSKALMHHKLFILDRETVIFGSYNFTNSANDSNDENLVIVTDPQFAAQFVEEFDAVWREAPGLTDWFFEKIVGFFG